MSIAQVVVDSIDVTALANNVVSHLVSKKRGTKENKFETIYVDDGTLDTPDGPLHAATTPYQYQEAPCDGNDVVDFPGFRTGGGRKSKVAMVTAAMLKVADELDEKEEIWQLFSQLDITKETAYETFCDVAMGLFQHGISWGKIVMLFMFAAHCVLKAVLSELPNILVMICSFVARFTGERLRQWIEDHGGWESLLDPSSSPLLFMGGILVVGIFGGFLVKVVWDKLGQ